MKGEDAKHVEVKTTHRTNVQILQHKRIKGICRRGRIRETNPATFVKVKGIGSITMGQRKCESYDNELSETVLWDRTQSEKFAHTSSWHVATTANVS